MTVRYSFDLPSGGSVQLVERDHPAVGTYLAVERLDGNGHVTAVVPWPRESLDRFAETVDDSRNRICGHPRHRGEVDPVLRGRKL